MITVQRVAKAAGKHLTRTALKLRQALGARASRGCPACGRTVVGFFRYGNNPDELRERVSQILDESNQ